MFFSKFTLQHYRGFNDVQTLVFGIPVEGKPGSGITYIVGENNAGKTTTLEALFQRSGLRIRQSEIPLTGSPLFQLYDNESTLRRSVALIRPTSYALVEDPLLNGVEFEMVPARRHWDARIQANLNFEQMMQQISHKPLRERDQNTANTISVALKSIETDEIKFQQFIKLVKEVLPEFNHFAIGFEEEEYVEYTTSGNVKHRSDYLGDGVISIIRILAHLFNGKGQPLVIDEPELSLHPLAQKRLYEVIARYAEQRQIIISTHSPYLVSWEHIKNGAKLNKVAKHGDNKSEIYTLKEYASYERLLSGANWQQPFLMDVVAKEIFFHDSFLFVEGQEDVGLLLKDNLLEDKINLFGYGVRGKDSFKFALQLAKDLGIKKAAVILDAGGSEKIIRDDLFASFPDYKIVQWNREDIRDKEAHTSTEKTGYFTKKGIKKQDLDDYDTKIQELNNYFSSP